MFDNNDSDDFVISDIHSVSKKLTKEHYTNTEDSKSFRPNVTPEIANGTPKSTPGKPTKNLTPITFELVDGFNTCSNSEYHADRKYLSSSVLKTVLESLNKYHHEYILGLKEPYSTSTQNNFDVGTLIHSMILEPDTVATGFNFYKGFRKAGAEFDTFLRNCKDGTLPIISVNQHKVASELFEAFNKLDAAKNLIRNGAAEQTICGNIAGVPIKTRYDWINVEEGYIADVKSTGYGSDKESFAQTIENFKYDLSGALYTMMAEQHYGRKFDFYYIVVSKKDKTCDVYKTSTQRMLDGRKKVIQACEKYLRAKETNVWKEVADSSTIILTDADAIVPNKPYTIEEI